jgi:hypothetical protein
MRLRRSSVDVMQGFNEPEFLVVGYGFHAFEIEALVGYGVVASVEKGNMKPSASVYSRCGCARLKTSATRFSHWSRNASGDLFGLESAACGVMRSIENKLQKTAEVRRRISAPVAERLERLVSLYSSDQDTRRCGCGLRGPLRPKAPE